MEITPVVGWLPRTEAVIRLDDRFDPAQERSGARRGTRGAARQGPAQPYEVSPVLDEFGPQGPTHQPIWATELKAES